MVKDINDLSDQEVIGRLLDVPSRLDAIEKIAEGSLNEDGTSKIDLVVKDFEWLCEMYETFCKSFSGPYVVEENSLEASYEVDFNEVDRNSSNPAKILAATSLGHEIQETSEYLVQNLTENGYFEEAEKVISARTKTLDNYK